VRQAEYFYKIPTNEGKFDNGKDFYQGQQISIMDIPDKEEEEEEVDGEEETHSGTSKAGNDDIVFCD